MTSRGRIPEFLVWHRTLLDFWVTVKQHVMRLHSVSEVVLLLTMFMFVCKLKPEVEILHNREIAIRWDR